MRYVIFAVLAVGLASACTKPNPEFAAECTGGGSCTAAAPYCDQTNGTCAATCTVDAECPGFAQDASDMFCVAGACVTCRMGMDDCPMAAPICTAENVCAACSANTQCESGACAGNGACVDEADVAYVTPNGTPTGPCSKANPCASVSYAVTTSSAQYVVIGSGTYTAENVIKVAGPRALIGSGSTSPELRNLGAADVIDVASGVVSLDNLDIGGATLSDGSGGFGVACRTVDAGSAAELLISRSSIHDNVVAGVQSSCPATIVTSSFTGNVTGLALTGPGQVDRCVISGNQSGVNALGGPVQITNSFITRNTGPNTFNGGLTLALTAGVIEFNTLADNSPTGFSCGSGATVDISNNIIARNDTNTGGSGDCAFNSLVTTDVTALRFKSPDNPPYDYHLTHGSSAIDAASTSTIDHDFDGDHRPMGSASDIGADEAE